MSLETDSQMSLLEGHADVQPQTSHREPGRARFWPGRAGLIAFLVSAVIVAGVGLLVLQAFSTAPQGSLESVGATDASGGSDSSVAGSGAAPASSSPATRAPVASGPPKSLGTVRGGYTLRGPRAAAPGSWATFILTGPKRVVRTDAAAPFAVRLDTRTIPNGRYTLTVVVLRAGAPAKTATRLLRVLNPKKAAAKPVSTPTGGRGAGTGSGTGSAAGSGTGSGSSAGSSVAAQVVSLTNAERAKNGCRALAVNSSLTQAAQAHSADMAAKNYFAHDSQDGRSPFDRMKAAGYSYRMAAENIAMGQRSARDVMTAWMNSAGHRANILNCGLTQIGVGYAVNSSGTPYWTQDFGTPS